MLRLACAFIAAMGIASLRAEEALPAQYLKVYVGINEAQHLLQQGDVAGSLKGFISCFDQFKAIHDAHPDWETALVLHRLADCEKVIADLQDKLAKANPAAAPVPFQPAKFVNAGRTDYPWKVGIVATLFWIGQDAKVNAWDPNRTQENGGVDTPADRNGYTPAKHASGVNPFYVALPFNDLAHPELAREFLPRGWARSAVDGKAVSACKDRWVILRNASGRTCYAQWEDVGPSGDDQAAYVFGPQAPKSADQPAIAISPAVAQYFGFRSDNPGMAWRFVDDQDVPPGKWLLFDEQAVLYTALHAER